MWTAKWGRGYQRRGSSEHWKDQKVAQAGALRKVLAAPGRKAAGSDAGSEVRVVRRCCPPCGLPSGGAATGDWPHPAARPWGVTSARNGPSGTPLLSAIIGIQNSCFDEGA